MPSAFIGIYVALYPYAAQTEQELSVEQGDLLYLLEKSTEDDWWRVKKRVLGSETEEPTGLVPNTYIEQVCLAFTFNIFNASSKPVYFSLTLINVLLGSYRWLRQSSVRIR